ncbi:hypothetical protein AMS68_000326 [Peltaster fructicola]|uniref:Uncharacterized protein n=1 Tax=Peltaster fructicola TaxID=286661 RepID=A0A6H0XJJ6_9PEZI|nr:hypothetical protein AMS68_000326 [Peltaster fructicola]
MARTVALKLKYTSRSGLVKAPEYTIREDPPWLQTRSYSEGAAPEVRRASSTYSVDIDDLVAAMGEDMQPAFDGATSPTSHSFAHPHQEITDLGPQTRTTRLPIFKQVRSMLSNNRGMPANTSPTSAAAAAAAAIKWDEYSGEISEHGKEARIKPSTYKNPYEGILKSRLQPSAASSSRQPQQYLSQQQQERRSGSPVSMLVDADLQLLEQEPGNMSPPNSRPVSPVSAASPVAPMHIEPMHVEPVAPVYLEPVAPARPKTSGDATRLKRKPVASSQNEHFSEPAELRQLPNSSHGPASHSDDPSSRFSWTTAAPSEAPRKSTDTRWSRQTRAVSDMDPQNHNSHFSWSTVASAVPGALREQTPPPSPPPVPVQYLEPATYGPPHSTQSILSRQRPYKRLDKPEWAPPPAPVSEGYTPRSLTPKVHRIEEHPTSTTPSADGKKRLPLPPLFTEKSLSHLEALLTQEKNILVQRRNIERSIAELERVETASPLEVSFSVVREAKKKLEERRKVLDEIRLEEMDVGIRIARARRKEDFADGEGTFWVRRVTG